MITTTPDVIMDVLVGFTILDYPPETPPPTPPPWPNNVLVTFD
jgi:hypothetical protein